MRYTPDELELIFDRTDGYCHLCGGDCASATMGNTENVALGKWSTPRRAATGAPIAYATCTRPTSPAIGKKEYPPLEPPALGMVGLRLHYQETGKNKFVTTIDGGGVLREHCLVRPSPDRQGLSLVR